MPHAQAVLDADSDAMNAVLVHLNASGDYRTARTLQHRRYIALNHDLGPEHPKTLGAQADLAFFTGRAGGTAGARDQYEMLLPVFERVMGPKRPDTLATRAQDHLLQSEVLAAVDCREIVEKTASTRKGRPKLAATVTRMRAGDTLVIYKPDQVARSVKELLLFLEEELAPRGINLQILSGICAGLHRPGGQTVADEMLFMAAEMERDLIRERTLDGLAAAAAHGRKGGRPPVVSDDVLAAAPAWRARGRACASRQAPLRSRSMVLKNCSEISW